MNSHTPRPWHSRPDRALKGSASLVVDDGLAIIADIWPNGTNENSLANAQLISAAPDLLEAARLAVDLIEGWMGHFKREHGIIWKGNPPSLDALHAAIAKATEPDLNEQEKHHD